MKDSVIVLSGGLDSVTLLYERKDEIELAISFNYGGNHNKRELKCADYHCTALGIKHITIPLSFIKKYFVSSLLQGGNAVPDGRDNEQSQMSTIVPFRNGIMLSIACGIAESNGLKKVFIASQAGGYTFYPDCRADFIKAMSEAMQKGTYENVIIEAPYTNMSKGEIAVIGKRLHLDYTTTYSCYKGGEKHCGKCRTCIKRREALAFAGITDNTEYEDV